MTFLRVMVIKVSQLWFLDTGIFWLLFRILKLIYFPTITNEETYVAGGGAAKSCF